MAVRWLWDVYQKIMRYLWDEGFIGLPTTLNYSIWGLVEPHKGKNHL